MSDQDVWITARMENFSVAEEIAAKLVTELYVSNGYRINAEPPANPKQPVSIFVLSFQPRDGKDPQQRIADLYRELWGDPPVPFIDADAKTPWTPAQQQLADAEARYNASMASYPDDNTSTTARIERLHRAIELAAILESEGLIKGYAVYPEPPAYANKPVEIYSLLFSELKGRQAEERLHQLYEERYGTFPDGFIGYQSSHSC